MRNLPFFLLAAGAMAGAPAAGVDDARMVEANVLERDLPPVAHELPHLPGFYAWPAPRNPGTTARRAWSRRVRSGAARNRPRR